MTELISLKFNLNVSKEDVRMTLLKVDPIGVEIRRNKTIKRRIYQTNGPMDILHIDGNDKLKRFGFAIHGCIDGFSRKLLWLNVSTTNNDPLVIANYYINCVSTFKKAPRLLRMDKGTENIYCQDLQIFWTKSESSYLNAASTHNQRIESSWSRLKKFKLSWWIRFFSSMVNDLIHKSACPFHKEVLLFCFMPVIQAELNEWLRCWNTRRVRQSASAPGGIPELLFNIPSIVGFKEQGVVVNDIDIQAARTILGIEHAPMTKDQDLQELLFCYIQIHNLSIPHDPESGLNLYIKLLTYLIVDGFNV